MTAAEKKLCDWQYKRLGGFFTALFDLMARADPDNLVKLAVGFSDEVNVFTRFKTDEGYFPKLEQEYLGEKINAKEIKCR
jgi:hypothetical protein